MNKKTMAIILAILASFGGIAIYLLLYNVLGLLAFISPIACAVLFILVYTKLIGENPAKKDVVIGVILAGVFTIVNTLIATVVGWQIDLAVFNADYGTNFTLGQLFEITEFVDAVTRDIIFNCLACLVAVGYLVFNVISANRAKSMPVSMQQTKDTISGTAEVIENKDIKNDNTEQKQ